MNEIKNLNASGNLNENLNENVGVGIGVNVNANENTCPVVNKSICRRGAGVSSDKTISIYIVEDYNLLRMQYKHILSKEKDFNVLDTFENAEDCIESLEVIDSIKSADSMNRAGVHCVNSGNMSINYDNVSGGRVCGVNSSARYPDIIIMDLGLPYMNGIQATKIIKDKYPNIKVIVLTCHEERETILACLSSKASGYILKNEETVKDSIKKAIRTVYQGGMWLDKEITDYAFSTIPKPISYEFENLYQKDENELRDYITSLLSKRELETLELITDGKTNDEIAELLIVSKNTIKMHVRSILSKLSVNDRIQAAVKAVRARLF